MTTCWMQRWSASAKPGGAPGQGRFATASRTAVPGSVSQWMGASGAISAGSTKGAETPIVGGRGTRHAPNSLAGWQVATVVTGAAARKVTPVVGIAAERLPRDFFVVQCQDVVVGAKVWQPCWRDRGLATGMAQPPTLPTRAGSSSGRASTCNAITVIGTLQSEADKVSHRQFRYGKSADTDAERRMQDRRLMCGMINQT